MNTYGKDVSLDDRSLYSFFSHLYHLSSMRLHLMAYVLSSLEGSTSLDLGLH